MKKILISGSSSGMGRAFAEKMLHENYEVIGLARDHSKFRPDTPHYHTYTVDFSKIQLLEQQFKTIQEHHPVLDVIVSSAGYGEFCELEQLSLARMQNMLNVNFLSQAVLIKFFLPVMKMNKSGKIIIIGSECALEGQKKGSLYCASKFALRGFAQSLRKECVTANISVTMINPGLVDTAFFDDLSFRPGRDSYNAIQPGQVADIIALVVNQENNCVVEEINLQPLKK